MEKIPIYCPNCYRHIFIKNRDAFSKCGPENWEVEEQCTECNSVFPINNNNVGSIIGINIAYLAPERETEPDNMWIDFPLV